MNPTLDQLVALARADEVRRLERSPSDRLRLRRFRRVAPARQALDTEPRRPAA